MRQQHGFTLIELMVTMAVLAIVIGIAVPSFNNLIQNNRSVALGEELVTALNFARSEAVKRGGRVSLCASADGIACSNNWTDGWMVFVDTAASDTATPPVVANAAAVLRVWQAPNANASITVTQNAVDTNFVRYNSLGALARTGNVSIRSQLSGCTGESARTITVNRGGTISVANSACN
jgi:type IV fimbrial biogenesis protein FimT